MKKILLASTILVGTAGFAAAEVSFSGEAFIGVVSGNSGATWQGASTASLDVAMSGETDGGLMFGADFTIETGGYTGTAFAPTSGRTVGGPAVWISGEFGKVTLESDWWNGDLDLSYEHSFGAFSIEVNAELLATPSPWDFELGYDFGDYDIYVNHASTGVTGLGANAAFGDFSLGLDIGDVALSSTTWEVALGYATGAISVDVTVGAGNTWELEGAYDLGGGAAVEASFDDAGSYSLGIAMGF